MSSQITITLRGMNLGERHRYLNSLVAQAFDLGEPFEAIIVLPELSPVDRLFKIDLASKYKNVDYILKNLRDDDMLYISRALKCKWILHEEYRKFINPAYLENVLYPEMITTAVNKMKQWTYLNLNDSVRCLEFYEYYCEKGFDYAFKFLSKCPEDTIIQEFEKEETLKKITPHRLKILCEKTPAIAKIFFGKLINNELLLKNYNAKSSKYFNSLKCILKIDADLFLNIIEEHFMINFKRLSKNATKFILIHRKNRFMLKPELYTARILHVDTLAQCLTQEECEELVIKLARARYLVDKEHWFNYKNVEPLVKRLDFKKRADFKIIIFVDKHFGEIVTSWPYPVPEVKVNNENTDVFLDKNVSPGQYDHNYSVADRFLACRRRYTEPKAKTRKTTLDALFDEYRFISFDKTLFEFRKKIACESSPQNRMFMMLVLVSKSGGKTENLKKLIPFLMKHRNETAQIRATIIRSLVKRACIWRVTEDIWKDILVFGQGLGLDGDTPEADCDEGLHAVLIRTILSDHDCDSAVKNAYIEKFSLLNSYSLTGAEKERISKSIIDILLEIANAESSADVVAQILEYSLKIIHAYKIKIETRPDVVSSIKNLVKKDQTVAKDLLELLFYSKLGRKEFIKENFGLIQTDASYVNALKHDITILSADKFVVATSLRYHKLIAEQFLRKISIYFNENEGLANCYLIAIKKQQYLKEFARPLAYLIGVDLKSYITALDTKDDKAKIFSARIRANAHVARPAFNIDSLEWRKRGGKLIVNKIIKCRAVEIDFLIKRLLSSNRTRLAIALARRTNYEFEVLADTAKIRPAIALKSAVSYFRRNGDQSDMRIWKIVKPLILKVKKSMKESHHRQFIRNISKIGSIPLIIRPDYATEVFKVLNENDINPCMRVLCHIMLVLPKIEEDFIELVMRDFFQGRLIVEAKYYNYGKDTIGTLLSRILAKYLLLCKTVESQNRRFEKVGQLYLDRMKYFWENGKNKMFFTWLNAVISSFMYYEVFLNEEYVSCLPVMETFLEWMKTILPIEKYFDTYLPLYLTVLYYKAIQQTAKEMPDILADEERRRNEGIKIVGETFGKNIGLEAQQMVKSYFDSIVVLYAHGLLSYMRNYFNNGQFRMIPYIIKGIIEVSNGIECIIALRLYYKHYRSFNDNEIDGVIYECLRRKDLIELRFCFNGKTNLSIEYSSRLQM